MAVNLLLRVRHDGTFTDLVRADVLAPSAADRFFGDALPSNTVIFGLRLIDANTLQTAPISVSGNPPTQVAEVNRYELVLPNGTVIGTFEKVEPV